MDLARPYKLLIMFNLLRKKMIISSETTVSSSVTSSVQSDSKQKSLLSRPKQSKLVLSDYHNINFVHLQAIGSSQ